MASMRSWHLIKELKKAKEQIMGIFEGKTFSVERTANAEA